MTHILERTGTWFKSRYLDSTDERKLRWVRRIYERILTTVTLGRGVPRLINGQDLIRVSVHHRYVDENYEPEVFEFLKREVKPDDIILDVGAYIGLYSIILSRYLGDRGKIYAFEPAPDSGKLLSTHLKMNNVGNRVEVLSCGVGESCGRGRLFTIGDHIQNSLSSTALGDDVTANAVDISIVSLDVFCEKRSILPDWVKVDTEGWELQVLRGAVGLFSAHKAIRFVVEMHPYAWRSAGYDAKIFKKFCADNFLRVMPLSGQTDMYSEYGQVVISVDA